MKYLVVGEASTGRCEILGEMYYRNDRVGGHTALAVFSGNYCLGRLKMSPKRISRSWSLSSNVVVSDVEEIIERSIKFLTQYNNLLVHEQRRG